MAGIYRKEGSKYWHCTFRDSLGKSFSRSTKTTNQREARNFAIEIEKAARLSTKGDLQERQARKILNDLMERVGVERLKSPSLKEVLRDWLESKEEVKSSRTYVKYQKTIQDFMKMMAAKSEQSIDHVQPKDIQAFLSFRKKQGVSPTTYNTDIKILRTAFNYARRLGIITTNPAEAVELSKSQSVQREVFTLEEIKMLIDAAKGEWKTLIRVAFYTGARLSDCCNMRWEGVDFTKGTLSFDVQKTGKPMVQPLHPSLRDHLEALAGQDTPQEFIMPGMAGKGSGGRHGMSEGFKRIVRNAGLDLQTVQGGGKRKISKRTFHALRHSFTSHLANAGVPEDIRMKLTGHTTKAIHQGYTHHELEVLQGAMGKIETL